MSNGLLTKRFNRQVVKTLSFALGPRVCMVPWDNLVPWTFAVLALKDEGRLHWDRLFDSQEKYFLTKDFCMSSKFQNRLCLKYIAPVTFISLSVVRTRSQTFCQFSASNYHRGNHHVELHVVITGSAGTRIFPCQPHWQKTRTTRLTCRSVRVLTNKSNIFSCEIAEQTPQKESPL